jgi:hypothetical protein
MRYIFKTLLLALIFLSVLSPAIAQEYGSKVRQSENDESNVLSSFSVGPEFDFVDMDNAYDGIIQPTDPVYLHMNPNYGKVSKNDVRITAYENREDLGPGTLVRAGDPDLDLPLTRFGVPPYPPAELRYFDVEGDEIYSLEDPVYLDIKPGKVNSGDIRITAYPLSLQGLPVQDGNVNPYAPGSRVRDGDPDSDKMTTTLPGMLNFYNANGNIDTRGSAYYDTGDLIYIDTNYPFNSVTINDIRLFASALGLSDLMQNGICTSPTCMQESYPGPMGPNSMMN